jgi:hypothetical protein
MSDMLVQESAGSLWSLSYDRRTVRLQVPPLMLEGQDEPLKIHLDFDAESIDLILQRLTELRVKMVPPPVRS